MRRSQVIAIYVLVASVLLVAGVTLLVAQWIIPGTGSIKGVKVGAYWDPQCKNPTSTLDFGLLEPGSSKDFTLYIRNEGNSSLILSMTSENWDPINAPDYITLTWNREGQQISMDEVIDVVIMLSVLETIQDFNSFSLDIIISGIG